MKRVICVLPLKLEKHSYPVKTLLLPPLPLPTQCKIETREKLQCLTFADRRPQTVDYRLQIAYSGPQTVDYKTLTEDPSEECWPQIL